MSDPFDSEEEEEEEGSPPLPDSTFRPVILRALKCYQKKLNDLASIKKGGWVFHEEDPFGYYLANRLTHVREITRELETIKYQQLSDIIRREEYKATVYEALAYFCAELKKNGKIIKEELGEEGDPTLFNQFNTQINRAKILMNMYTEDNYF